MNRISFTMHGKKTNRLLWVPVCILLSYAAKGQNQIFSSPLKNSLSLAGSFGEARPDHFHSGMDLKTGEREGLPVYSVMDGYVSRIRITLSGYGKALYITHPNGFTSVYGHLQTYSYDINKEVLKQQYAGKTYEIELRFPPDRFPVKQGDLVAFSGNSGGSSAPHLHFELRDTKTEEAVNPQLYGFTIDDSKGPQLIRLAIYSFHGSIPPEPVIFNIQNKTGRYFLNSPDTLLLRGETGFGIEAYDIPEGSTSKNGPYRVTLYIDGELFFESCLTKINFSKTRYANAYFDYRDNALNKRYLIKSFLSANNTLDIYRHSNKDGHIRFADDIAHKIQYLVSDAQNNLSMLEFYAKNDPSYVESQIDAPKHLFRFDQENKLQDDDVRLRIPNLALYDDLDFEYSKNTSSQKNLSPVYHLDHFYNPLQKACTLSVRIPDQVSSQLIPKLEMVYINEKKELCGAGGNPVKGFLETKIRKLGDYTLMLDTLPPVLMNTPSIKTESESFNFEAKDELSGIEAYNAYIDGNWILLEYDAKKNRFSHHFEMAANGQSHQLLIVISDKRNNFLTYKSEFIR